jgi:hypothetical protein
MQLSAFAHSPVPPSQIPLSHCCENVHGLPIVCFALQICVAVSQ